MKVISNVETIVKYDENGNIIYRKVITTKKTFKPKTNSSHHRYTYSRDVVCEETFHYNDDGELMYSENSKGDREYKS